MPIVTLNVFEGINRLAADDLTKPSELRLAINCDSYILGAKKKRVGYVKFLNNPDSSSIQGLFYWIKADGTKLLFRVSNGKVYKYQFGSGASTWTLTSKTGLSTTDKMSFSLLNGNLFFSNGVDNMFYTADGSTFTNITTGTPPKPRFLKTFQGRIYGAGSTTEVGTQTSGAGPSSIYWSSVNDGTDWTIDLNNPAKAGWRYIDPDENGRVTGLGKILDRLIIFKQGAVYKYDGSTLTDLNYVPTTSHLSISSYKDYIFFINYDGIWGYAGATPELFSKPLRDFINNISGTNFTQASGIVYNKQYFCSVGDVTTDDGETYPNCVLVLDFDNSMWYVHSFAHKPVAWSTAIDENNNFKLYFGDNNGQCYLWNSGTSDDGNPIQMVIETKNFDEGYPQVDKKYSKMYVEAKPHNGLKLYYSVDDGDWRLAGECVNTLTRFYFDPDITNSFHQRIKFRLVESGTNIQPVVRKIIYHYDVSGGESGKTRR